MLAIHEQVWSQNGREVKGLDLVRELRVLGMIHPDAVVSNRAQGQFINYTGFRWKRIK